MSTGRQTRGPDGQYRNQRARRWQVSRYDIVLALIPMAFLLTAVASGLFGVALPTALAGGSVLGVAVLADALFLNPPTERLK
ncbi:hypothetical protein NDI56_08880 [Haloarcula sp. S1CR25-12]|uniref:Uncharacterized protein n=1 Tax=Haloarcula saliterrae TaxID=2950534 RepID=A0ABU2FCP5_9EURY|nr:hypothetical protein [Haloarcula sp. S1CR25-12]MDS0259506.1 hypothetical protein [Haloarcula sp. S1CR25-12]